MIGKDDVLGVVVVVVLVVVLMTGSWLINGWRYEAEIANLNKMHAEAATRAATAHVRAMAEAAARGEAIVLANAAREIALNQALEDKNEEIRRLATGRRCLDARVVGVLNRRDGAATHGGAVSQAAAQPVRPAAGAAAGADDGQGAIASAAAGEPYASDGDVAGWMALCRARYDACRADRDDLRQFYSASQPADE